jgi:hypothetical protein
MEIIRRVGIAMVVDRDNLRLLLLLDQVRE